MTAGWPRGSLRRCLRAAARSALDAGALQPIVTHVEAVSDGGIEYLVRVVDSIRRKQQARAVQGPANPFLPYDPHMYVADVAPAHVVLLNKFNVLDGHALIVTREFEPQSAPLDADDFTALWHCLRETEGLAFYNGGAVAGASQPHKHLQWVPLPLTQQAPHLPVEARVMAAVSAGERRAELPFTHAVAPVSLPDDAAPEAAGRVLKQGYDLLLRAIGRDPAAAVCDHYNWLATRRWMMAVPRTQEAVQGIGVNALGFAGALLVRDQTDLETLRRLTPSALLRQVSDGRPAAQK